MNNQLFQFQVTVYSKVKMSASLRFPKYLSDLIVSKGIAHIEPEWNFSISNGKLSLNLVWSNVQTDHLLLSPPPLPATKFPSQSGNINVPPTYENKVPVRNCKNLPPRFLKRFKGKDENEFFENVLKNAGDQSLELQTEEKSKDTTSANDLGSDEPTEVESVDRECKSLPSVSSHDESVESIVSIANSSRDYLVHSNIPRDSSIVNYEYDHNVLSHEHEKGNIESNHGNTISRIDSIECMEGILSHS